MILDAYSRASVSRSDQSRFNYVMTGAARTYEIIMPLRYLVKANGARSSLSQRKTCLPLGREIVASSQARFTIAPRFFSPLPSADTISTFCAVTSDYFSLIFLQLFSFSGLPPLLMAVDARNRQIRMPARSDDDARPARPRYLRRMSRCRACECVVRIAPSCRCLFNCSCIS